MDKSTICSMTLKKSEYSTYMNSKAWRNRRRAFKRKPENRYCKVCKVRENLHVHHKSYGKAGRGGEPDRDLVTLCQEHHSEVHKLHKKNGGSLRKVTNSYIVEQTGEPLHHQNPPKPKKRKKYPKPCLNCRNITEPKERCVRCSAPTKKSQQTVKPVNTPTTSIVVSKTKRNPKCRTKGKLKVSMMSPEQMAEFSK